MLGLACHLVAEVTHGIDALLKGRTEEGTYLCEVGHGGGDALAVGIGHDAAVGEWLYGHVGLYLGEERLAGFVEGFLLLLFVVSFLLLLGGSAHVALGFGSLGDWDNLQAGDQLAHTAVVVAETMRVSHESLCAGHAFEQCQSLLEGFFLFGCQHSGVECRREYLDDLLFVHIVVSFIVVGVLEHEWCDEYLAALLVVLVAAGFVCSG